MPFFRRENIDFYFEEYGTGLPLVFSHGLGGNLTNVKELFGERPGARLILYDNRGHGRTATVGDPSRLTFPVMAEDMAALLDFLEIPAAVIGGVSMGAGIATAFAVKNPGRTRALILTRPAWLNSPCPSCLAVLPEMADLVEQFGREGAAEHFVRSERYASLERTAPEVAKSLADSFLERDAAAMIATFRCITASAPFHSWEELDKIGVRALILANRNDPLHPFEYCERLSAALPQACMREFPSKSQSLELYFQRFRELVTEFLHAHVTP